MANEGYEHGIDWVQIDDDGGALGPLLNAALPPATVRASTLCYSRTGDRWWGCIVSNPLTSAHQWVVIAAGGGGGGGGPGTKLLYVVGEVVATPGVNTPMGLLMGTFPDVETAYAQAAADFALLPGPPRFNADFIVMPGTYPGFRLRPGMHVSLVVDGGFETSPVPPAPSTDTPALTFTSTIELRGSDGWVVGPTLPNASLRGAKVATGGTPSVRIAADVRAGTVLISDALLNISAGTAIQEVAGASGLTLQLQNTRVEALGLVAFNGALCKLQAYTGSRILGTTTTSIAEGLAFADGFVIGSHIIATGAVPPGSAHVRLYRTALISVDGSSVATLNGGAVMFVEAGCAIENATPTSIDGTGGTVVLAGGALPGFVGAPSQIRFESAGMGLSYRTPPAGFPDVNADGYVAPIGAGPFTYTIPSGVGAEFFPLDCTDATAGADVTIVLPDARLAMAWSELVVKRIDNNPAPVTRVTCSPGNEFDKYSPTLTSFTFGAGDSLRFRASREPVGGIGRWLLVP